MLTDKNESLTPDEFRALRDIKGQRATLLSRKIPSATKAKLIRQGFATEQKSVLGGVTLTIKGEQRLKAGK